jgi:hypothetical protein
MSLRTSASRAVATGLTAAGVALLPVIVTGQQPPGPDGLYFNRARPGLNPFERSKATVHFTLYTDGAAIDLQVVHATDDVTRHEVELHMQRVAMALTDGDFSAMRSAQVPATQPTHLHVLAPNGRPATGDASTFFVPGVATLTRLAREVKYAYVETSEGGRVDIRTTSSEALGALHDFLRFQINQHATGDSPTVTKR